MAAALRAHAAGLSCLQAAVELLIGHRRWLYRDDFVDQFVRLTPAPVAGGVVAVVAWWAAIQALSTGRLSYSDSEGYVLRIAASIAEGVAVDLRICLSMLDGADIGLVANAVRRAGGHAAPDDATAGRGVW